MKDEEVVNLLTVMLIKSNALIGVVNASCCAA